MAKTRKNKTKWKIQRRLGVELPGLGRPGALVKRPHPPGDHGAGRQRTTEYGLRLAEKQKVMFHYGLREKQMRRFVTYAKKHAKSNWIEGFFQILESRLDNLVFRLGFAPSIPAAAQMIRHRKVLVNGERQSIPSYIVPVGAEISLVDSFYELPIYIQTRQKPRLELPSFLSIKTDKKKDIGQFVSAPSSEHVPFELESRFIAEFYS